MSVQTKASRVRLLLFDVDGVLTTGEVIMHADGSESKGFHIRDGAAIVWAQRAGLTVGLLSARSSGATAHRAAQLAVRIVEQGVKSKIAAYEQIIRDAKVDDRDVAYMGDDLLDLQVLARVGLSAPRPTRHQKCASGWIGSALSPVAEAQCASSSSWSSARSSVGTTCCDSIFLRRNGRLRHTPEHARRAAGRPGDWQGLGALQASRRPMDRSAARARIHPTTCSA